MLQIYADHECYNQLVMLSEKLFPQSEFCKDERSFCICFGTYNGSAFWDPPANLRPVWGLLPSAGQPNSEFIPSWLLSGPNPSGNIYEDYHSASDPSSVRLKNVTLKVGYAQADYASDVPDLLEDFCEDFFKDAWFSNSLIESMNCAPMGNYYLTVVDPSCMYHEQCARTPVLWIRSPAGVNVVRQDLQGFDQGATKFIASTFWVT
jgi:hypothetical protein